MPRQREYGRGRSCRATYYYFSKRQDVSETGLKLAEKGRNSRNLHREKIGACSFVLISVSGRMCRINLHGIKIIDIPCDGRFARYVYSFRRNINVQS